MPQRKSLPATLAAAAAFTLAACSSAESRTLQVSPDDAYCQTDGAGYFQILSTSNDVLYDIRDAQLVPSSGLYEASKEQITDFAGQGRVHGFASDNQSRCAVGTEKGIFVYGL